MGRGLSMGRSRLPGAQVEELLGSSRDALDRCTRDVRRWQQLAAGEGLAEFILRWDPEGTRFMEVVDECTDRVCALDAAVAQTTQVVQEEAAAEDTIVDLGARTGLWGGEGLLP